MLAILLLALTPVQDAPLPLVPWPADVTPLGGERFVLDAGTTILAEADALLPLARVLAGELELLAGVRPPVRTDVGAAGAIVLRVDALLPPGSYELGVRGAAVVTGHDIAAVAAGTTTLVQLLRVEGGLPFVPGVLLRDRPAREPGGLRIDCETHPQSLDTLRQVIEIARFYKLRRVYLQLGGDGALPRALRGLTEFASARGVELVPEGESAPPSASGSGEPLAIANGGKLTPQSAPLRPSPERIFSSLPSTTVMLEVRRQLEHSVVHDLPPRAAAFAERVWSAAPERSWDDFEARAAGAHAQLERLLRTVRILPDTLDETCRRVFDGELEVRVQAARPGAVHYTLDGSLPTAGSARYERPLVLRADTTIRARLFDRDGRPVGHGDHAVFAQRGLQRVRFRHYAAPEGGWRAVPDFMGRTVLRRGTQERLRGGFEAGPLGVVLQSTLTLPEAGEWELDLRSFEGPSRLFVDGVLICDRDRPRAGEGTLARLELAAGPHALEVRYAQGARQTLCRVFVRGPGVDEPVLADRFLSLPE